MKTFIDAALTNFVNERGFIATLADQIELIPIIALPVHVTAEHHAPGDPISRTVERAPRAYLNGSWILEAHGNAFP